MYSGNLLNSRLIPHPPSKHHWTHINKGNIYDVKKGAVMQCLDHSTWGCWPHVMLLIVLLSWDLIAHMCTLHSLIWYISTHKKPIKRVYLQIKAMLFFCYFKKFFDDTLFFQSTQKCSSVHISFILSFTVSHCSFYFYLSNINHWQTDALYVRDAETTSSFKSEKYTHSNSTGKNKEHHLDEEAWLSALLPEAKNKQTTSRSFCASLF